MFDFYLKFFLERSVFLPIILFGILVVVGCIDRRM